MQRSGRLALRVHGPSPRRLLEPITPSLRGTGGDVCAQALPAPDRSRRCVLAVGTLEWGPCSQTTDTPVFQGWGRSDLKRVLLDSENIVVARMGLPVL